MRSSVHRTEVCVMFEFESYHARHCSAESLRLDWPSAAEDSAVTPKMTAPGKLIAVEGIDGSGKRTQVELLTLTLKARGHSVYSTGFPQYDSWFGKMVGQFLNGDLGPLEGVDPHFTALLYAGDRFEAKPKLQSALNNGQIVLVDRYVGYNLAHQPPP